MKNIFILLLILTRWGICQDSAPLNEITPKKAEETLFYQLPYDPWGENRIGYLSIDRDHPINQSTFIYVKFALDSFKKQKVKFIVLHLDTPGGEVMSALKITNLLIKFQVEEKVPVIAFIDTWAVSAGAMLAYASKYIAIVKTSIMGAAEPVMAQTDGSMQSASEKINSALRAEFSNLARFYARDPLIAQAMVDKDILIVKRGGRIVELQNASEIKSTDVIVSKKGKLLTLDAKQLKELGIAEFEVPIKALVPITEKEMKEGKWPASKSLLFGFPFLKKIPNAVFISYQDWKITFFSLLTHPLVSSLIFMGFILGAYIELSTPGFGVFGAIALLCLSLILLSSFAIYAIGWLEVILLAIGVGLLLLELFVVPGFGVTGILGIIFIVVGIMALLLPLGHINMVEFEMSPFILKNLFIRLAFLSGSLILSLIIIAVLARFLSQRFLPLTRLVLKGEQEGFVSSGPRENWPDVGSEGIAKTPLRPAGKIEVNSTLYDALADGFFLEKGDPIKVLRVEGNKIVVTKK